MDFNSLVLKTFDAEEISYKGHRCVGKTGDKGLELVLCHKYKGLIFMLRFFVPEYGRYLTVKASVINDRSEAIKIKRIDVIRINATESGPESFLSISEDPETCYVYTNTLYKTPSMVRKLVDGFDCRFLDKNGDIKYLDRDYGLGWQAKYDGAIYDTISKRSIIFGFITYHKFMGEIELKYNRNQAKKGIGEFGLVNTCNDYMLEQGSECDSETVYINFCGDVHENQIHFAEMIGKIMAAKFLEYPPFGWCSWHYRFFDINEKSVLKNAEFAATRKDIFPVMPGGFEYIQIDYGWQKFIGSNEVDIDRFPNGMKWIADRIHSLGLKAGIWIAPFWIDEGCRLHETNPDYLLHDDDGNLIKVERGFKQMPFYRLDVSNPGAVKYVISRLDQIINEWGYDMVKMDFLEMATIRPLPEEIRIKHYDTRLSTYEHFRNACAAIRDYVESLNKDIFLSPCGSPLMFLTGIFRSNYVAEDAVVKLSPDLWNEHAGVKAFVRSWATKYYLNNRIWTNNCESIILDEHRPFNEAVINATSAALTGGLFFTGDELPALPEDRLKIYSKILPLYKEEAIPIDVFESENPVIWKLPVRANGEEWFVVGLFNLQDSSEDIDLTTTKLDIPEDKEYLMFDFWNEQFLGIFKESYIFKNVPGRSVKLVCMREKKARPQILSTDIHFTQGAVEFEKVAWDENTCSLRGVLKNYRPGPHKLFVYLSGGHVLKDFQPCDAVVDVKGSICVFTIPSANEKLKEFKLGFSNNT